MASDTRPAGEHSTFALPGEGNHAIKVFNWAPVSQRVLGTVQIVHGLVEHAARYQRFAEFLTKRGYAVIAHNHRGHGSHLELAQRGHFADQDGWQKVIDDVQRVNAHIRERHAEMPRVLIGHSMGSYIAQAFVMHNAIACDAFVLSGSNHAPRVQLHLGRLAARVVAWRHGSEHHSEFLDALAFGAFNKRFKPARTVFDWLSRDPDEVDRYVSDPACGVLASAGLWLDLLGGLLDIGRKKSLKKIPGDLPILITGGSDDPVGGRRGMQRLAKAYRDTGHHNVSVKIYDGGRHEMLNETNRDEVMSDIAEWMAGALTLGQPAAQ